MTRRYSSRSGSPVSPLNWKGTNCGLAIRWLSDSRVPTVILTCSPTRMCLMCTVQMSVNILVCLAATTTVWVHRSPGWKARSHFASSRVGFPT